MNSAQSNTFVNFALGIIVLFLVVWVLIVGRTIILPFMVAMFLTFMLEPLVNLFGKIRCPRRLAVIITLVVSFVVIYLLGLLVYANVEQFVDRFPVYQERLISLLNSTIRSVEKLIGKELSVDLLKRINWLDAFQGMSIAGNVVSGVGTFFSFFMKMLIVIVFMAYMLAGQPRFKRKVAAAFPESQSRSIEGMIDAITSKIQTYLSTKTVVSFVTALIALVIFWGFGLDFAVFWAFVIFLFNFIPNIGSIIASFLPVLFSVLQFGSFGTALWLLIALSILQFIMGNVIEPRIMGYSLDLSPVMVIISLIFWGYIWGVAGMLLSVPILATLTIITERIESLRFISVFLKGKVTDHS
ncbi:MAG: AI-2E family transporter [Calditrichaeota bacterium]|nr:MAG: AI-2E family transporter [Calditrichota bacterium]